MKTYVDWFSELPEPYKTQALENAIYQNRHSDNHLFVSMARAITETMMWSQTSQGHEYWNELYDKYTDEHRRVEREQETQEEKERQERNAAFRKSEEERIAKLVTFSMSMRDMLDELAEHCEVAVKLRRHSDKNLFCDYVTMRGDMCSYLPKGKEHIVTDEGKWRREGRQEIKPAKLARKVLPEGILSTLTEKDFELFNNMVRSYIGVNGDEDGEGRTLAMQVVEGEDIRTYYNERSYSNLANSDTNLWGSCMRYGSCSDYFDIYVENNIKMLIAKDLCGKIVGRALLWNCTDGRKAMDTIYSTESVRTLFTKWAIDNDYYYKSQQSCHHHEFDMYRGSRCDNWKAVVKLDTSHYHEYPYMDTMIYLDNDRKTLSNRDDNYTHTLRCTDGGYEENGVYDEFDDCTISEDDSVYLDYDTDEVRWCGTTHISNTVMTRDGYRVLDRDSVMVGDDYYAEGSDSIVWVDSRDEYFRVDDTTEAYNGDIIHEDDAQDCAHDGHTYHRDDMTEVEVYVWVHNDNVESYLEQLKEEENV